MLKFPPTNGVYSEQVEFLSAIREVREPESSGLDGARDLELVEAAYRAAGERRAIDLPLYDWSSLLRQPAAGNGIPLSPRTWERGRG